jgi:hypothetical protein
MNQNTGYTTATSVGSSSHGTGFAGHIRDPRFSIGKNYGMLCGKTGKRLFRQSNSCGGKVKGEGLTDALKRVAQKPIWRKINRGLGPLYQKAKTLGLFGNKPPLSSEKNDIFQETKALQGEQANVGLPHKPFQTDDTGGAGLTIEMKWNPAILTYEFSQIADDPRLRAKHALFSRQV